MKMRRRHPLRQKHLNREKLAVEILYVKQDRYCPGRAMEKILRDVALKIQNYEFYLLKLKTRYN